MLLAAVDIVIFQRAAGMAAGNGDLDGVDHRIGDDLHQFKGSFVESGYGLGIQSTAVQDFLHHFGVFKTQIHGQPQGAGIFAAEHAGCIDQFHGVTSS